VKCLKRAEQDLISSDRSLLALIFSISTTILKILMVLITLFNREGGGALGNNTNTKKSGGP
jgi:hypothetical protein